jgi:hypothetical protein
MESIAADFYVIKCFDVSSDCSFFAAFVISPPQAVESSMNEGLPDGVQWKNGQD